MAMMIFTPIGGGDGSCGTIGRWMWKWRGKAVMFFRQAILATSLTLRVSFLVNRPIKLKEKYQKAGA